MDQEKDENWQQLVSDMAKLSPKQRDHLAVHLMDDTLIMPGEKSPEEISQAWEEELLRRVDLIQSGKTQGIPAEKIFPSLGDLDS